MKPCPNCESISITMGVINGGYGRCEKCGMTGPSNDPRGVRWDALPRRGDAIESNTDREAWREYAIGAMRELIAKMPWSECDANDKAASQEIFNIHGSIALSAEGYANHMLAAEKHRFDNDTK